MLDFTVVELENQELFITFAADFIHFDGLSSHVRSCFPTTIITRVLLCGLKDYYQHMSGQTDGAHENKMSSVVGILSHMAVQHANDVHHAIWKLFQVSEMSSKD